MIEYWSIPENKAKASIFQIERHKNFPASDEVKSKISNSLLEYYSINPVNERSRKVNSEAQIKRHKENPDSEEIKLKRRKSIRKSLGTPVLMLSDDFSIIKKFDSAAEAVELGFAKYSQTIYTCCKRHELNPLKMYKSNGYYWKYVDVAS